MNKPLALVALSAALLVPAAASGQDESKVYPDNMLVKTLDNGLEVVIEENHTIPLVRVHAYMRIGSLYEGEYMGSGLSHYMEHIVSGGSTRRQVKDADGKLVWKGRTEQENKEILKSIGGDSNASTFYNFTQYYITTKSEMTESAVDLISDYLQNCQFDEVEVEREQRVVQQELLRNKDNPGRARAYLFAETMFKTHPVRVPVIGYQDCIQRITRDDQFRFYKKHYTPQNCVIAIVGDVDKEQTLRMIEEYFGGWKRKSLEPYSIPQEPEQSAMRWVEEEHGSTKTCLVAMGVPSIGLRHPDLYKLDMLANVLGSSASSRLPKKFEHDPSRKVVATGLSAGNWTPSFGAGRFGIYFSTDTVESSRQLVWEIWAEANRLKEELVSQEEIDRALKVLTKQFHAGRATVEDRAEELSSNLAWLNDPLFNETYLEKIREVTPEQVREAARKYLQKQRLNVAIITPPGQANRQPAAEETETAAIGEVKKVVLDNGLTLLLKRIPGYGMVDVTAAFNGGVIYEDEKTNGLFFLMANTFWRGSKTRPFPKLMSEMDGLGMEMGAESHNNVYFIQMRSLASDLEPAFGIFADVLLDPAIEEKWVEQIKMILLTRVLPNMEVQAGQIVEKALREGLYSKHPYQRQRMGSKETVGTFSAAQVRELYETYTRPNNCVMAIHGDFDPAKVEAVVRKALAGWEKKDVPASKVVEDAGPTESKTLDLTNAQVRTNYRVGWRAFSRQQKQERWAMTVMNSIIGASGWLHARLREGSADYVYAVHGAPYPGDGAGHYYINTDFQPKDEAKVLEIIDGVISDIRGGKFTDKELDLAKKQILCSDALRMKEHQNVCQGDALSELYGDGWNSEEEFFAGIKQVTREDVVKAANTIFERPSLKLLVRPKAGQ